MAYFSEAIQVKYLTHKYKMDLVISGLFVIMLVCVYPILLYPRYHKLVWGPHGMDSQGHPSGVLIAGGENGNLILYDPAKIIAGESDVIISQNDKHTGPVRALDVNPFQVCSYP